MTGQEFKNEVQMQAGFAVEKNRRMTFAAAMEAARETYGDDVRPLQFAAAYRSAINKFETEELLNVRYSTLFGGEWLKFKN